MEPKDQRRFCEVAPNTLNGLRSADSRRCSVSDASKNRHTPPAAIRPEHWAELQASGIAADVAALNVASFGPGTTRHWEDERGALVAHARLQIQTSSTTASGLPQAQPGHLTGRLIALDRRYRHLAGGGWRSLSAALPDLPVFDQWKPDKPRHRTDKPGKAIKYEAPPGFPDGGGLLLPQVPERIWELICNRQGLPFPADRAAGFWPWAIATPGLQLVLTEGWKKALAALSAGHAAVALPGVQMGRRRDADGSERLIEALQLLAPRRRWLIAFDAEAKRTTAAKVGAAAGALARSLRAADGRPEIARLPLLPGTDKTGLDDLLAAAGPEALDRALADTGPRPVLPWLRPADRIAPAGQWLSKACPIPSPAEAQLLLMQAPMGTGKTYAISEAIRPLQQAGTPVLVTSHRRTLGQSLAERLGVAWEPMPGSDARLLGAGFCLDSACPSSPLQIAGLSWNGGVLVLDELMQALEQLLLSTGTTLGKHRRAEVLRTLAELLPRQAQVIAADAQLADWAVQLMEALTGRRAQLIRSKHQPMAGRPLHAPDGFTTPQAAAQAFRAQWAELVAAGRPFLCWTSAQRADVANSPQRLAALHRQRCPDANVLVIDSSTPEAAAELAADPDGVAERFDALYVSPAISSGLSFERWKPAAVIAYAGGQIAPEHAAQALARVRCPEVPAWIFAPERCPGAALRVGSGSTDPAQLIARVSAALKAAAEAAREAADQALLDAPLLTADAAAELAKRRRLEPTDRLAFDRFQLAARWGLGDAAATLQLLEADRDGLRDRLRLGWLLTTPTAAALVPEHDRRQIAALDASGRPFEPDRPRVTLGTTLAAHASLGVPALLQRFQAGEVIAATDPAVVALHAAATAHRGQLAAAAGISPGKLATGTLRALLNACGWELKRSGRIKARGEGRRDAYTYRAAPIALPEGVNAEALQAIWLAELDQVTGAKTSPTEELCRGEKSPTRRPASPPPPHTPQRFRAMAGFSALLQALTPPCRAPGPASLNFSQPVRAGLRRDGP